MRFGLITVLLLSLMATGCASGIVYEGGYAFSDGWRPGRVTAVGEGAVFTENLHENCKAENQQPSAIQRYVTLRYTRAGHLARRSFPIAKDASWKVDDLVYVNVMDCKASLQVRTK